MNWWRRLRCQRQLERELDAELRDHIDRQIAHYMAAGLAETEARRRTTIEFGGLDQVKETCRDVRGLTLLHDAAADARYACRLLRAHVGFTSVAVLALGLGIGANTAMFSLVNGLLFQRPAVHEPDRLVFVTNCTGSERAIEGLRQQPGVFDGVAGWMATQFSLGSGGAAEWVDGLWVTPAYFETIGVGAAAGRIVADDGADRVVMISDGFWRRRFGRDPNVVGRSLSVNHVPFTIAGITPPDFTGLDVGRTFDVVAPLRAAPLVAPVDEEECGALSVVARLSAGQTIESAMATLRGTRETSVSLQPAEHGRSDLRARYERPLLTIMGVAALVLLTACATLANLLLARAAARRPEMGVRLALGATRGRLVRQLLIENAIVAALGAAGGLAFAWFGSRAIVTALAAESILATGRTIFGSARLHLDVSLDAHVLVFTVVVTLMTVLLFGTVPAVRASRAAPSAAPGRARAAQASGLVPGVATSLVVAQMALTFALVAAAGLFIRSLGSLLDVPLGFEPERMIVVDMHTPPAADPVRRMPLYERAREVVRVLPGVTEATLSVSAPMTGWDLLVEVETGVAAVSAGGNDSLANIVSPGWFRALGTPLVAGRDFTAADSADAPPVVVVNEAFSRQFLRDHQAIGRTMTIRGMGPERTPRRIVGVAADALWSLRDPVPPILYVPLAQADEESLELRVEEQGLTLGIRTGGDGPEQLTRTIAAALGEVDPRLTLTFRSPADHITASLTQERVMAIVSAFFAMLALVLAAVSLYGIAGCAVSRRRTEIGVRVALGAAPRAVVRAVLAPVWRLVGTGVGAGAFASVALAPFVSALLYGVGSRDLLTFSVSAVILSAVAAISGAIPAYRAARRNPVAVLRLE